MYAGFGQDFWFAGVQLAAYIQDASFDWHPIPAERAAQESVLELANTALITAIDLVRRLPFILRRHRSTRLCCSLFEETLLLIG